MSEVLDPKLSSFSSRMSSSEFDTFLNEISNASESFLQTLQIKSLVSSEAYGDDEEFSALSTLLNMLPVEDYSEDLLSRHSLLEMQSDFKCVIKYDDDDDMDNEWRRLGAAQENLRKELELASCGFVLQGHSHTRYTKEDIMTAPCDDTHYHDLYIADPSLRKKYLSMKSLLDNDNDADFQQHSDESENSSKPCSKPREQNLKAQDENADKGDSGYSFVSRQETEIPQMLSTGSLNPQTHAFHTSASLTEQACYISLHRLPCDLGAFSCPIFRPTVYYNKAHQNILPTEERTVFRQHFCREFVNRMPSTALRKLFIGLTDLPHKDRKSSFSVEHHETQSQDSASSTLSEEASMLQHSSRTCTIRVRPDILCGSIMDSVAHIISTLDGEILKRQGGHVRAIFPPVYKAMKHLSFRASSLGGSRTTVKDEMRLLPPWIMDAQVCTRKRSKDCERTLLIRVFHVPPSIHTEIPQTPSAKISIGEDDQNTIDDTILPESSVSCLWDAAHILYDMILDRGIGDGFISVDKTGEILSTSETIGAVAASPLSHSHVSQVLGTEECLSPSTASKVARTIGKFLVSPIMHMGGKSNNGKHSIARAMADHGLFPSLSNDDAPIVESAWDFIRKCTSELESRDLNYSSLSTNAFGAFPALSTIDNNYCSQLQLLVRESMVYSLLKTAAELEKFARDAEYSCANLVQLLKPAFAAYGIDAPGLPRPVPLSAYPLDFVPPEIAFPPWGQRVMEALSVISSASSSSLLEGKTLKNGFEHASKAVSSVVAAFQWQADEEQSARLGRKNMQVMDRLAKMQEHTRKSILAITSSFGESSAASKAATEFHAKAEHFVSNYDDLNTMSQQLVEPNDQVPLFQCSIFLGGATGMCFITAHQLLCATQLIPLVSGNRYHLFNLRDIELVVQEHPANSLMQLPPGISIRHISESNSGTCEEIRFIPSIDAQRFKEVVDAVRGHEAESSDSLKFSTRGGFLYMQDS